VIRRIVPLLALAGGMALGCAAWPGDDAARTPEAPTAPATAPASDEEVPAAAAHRSWLEPPPPIETGPVVDDERLHVATLGNGLRVIVLEDPRLPRFGLGLAVRRGAASEPIGQAGVASFLADLMERGAGERDALALAEAVDGLGASFGVSAGWDEMSADVSGLSRDLDALFPILVDLVRRPRLAPEEAEKVRAETLAALERAKDDPGTLAGWNLARAVYGEHRFGLSIDGTPESVGGLDAERARAFHERLFVPGNAILYASGDLDAEDVVARAEAAFGDWAAGPVPEPGLAPPARSPEARRIVVVDRPDLGQAQIMMGHEGVARTDPERIPAALMNVTLGGGGFSSRLMTVIREREGLAYGVGSAFRLRRGGGPFVVGGATRVPEARRAIDLMLAELTGDAPCPSTAAELEGIRASPPSAEEVAHARTYAAGRFVLGLETSGAVLASLVDLDVHGLPLDGLDTYRARVAAVTPEDAAEQARKRIHPDRAAIVVVGPAETLAPALEALGPVEVVEP